MQIETNHSNFNSIEHKSGCTDEHLLSIRVGQHSLFLDAFKTEGSKAKVYSHHNQPKIIMQTLL